MANTTITKAAAAQEAALTLLVEFGFRARKVVTRRGNAIAVALPGRFAPTYLNTLREAKQLVRTTRPR